MVIQRWQSVFLLIAAAVMACFTFMSLGQIQMTEYSLDFTTLGFEIEGESTDGAPSGYLMRTWPFFIVSLLSFLLPLINIFLFRNLRLQKNVCLLEVIILLGVVCTGCAYGYNAFEGYYVSWSSLIVAPLLAFVIDIMAFNRICRDQRALRSADRIR